MTPVIAAVMTALDCALVVGAILKSWVWINSARWAVDRGAAYALDVEKIEKPTAADRMHLIRKHGGDSFFIGAKSVRLYRTAPQIGWIGGPLLRYLFIVTPCFLVLVLSSAWVTVQVANWRVSQFVAGTLSGWACLYALGLIVEAITWYVIAQDYTRVWGSVKFAHRGTSEEHRIFGDVRGLVSVTLTAVGCTSILVATAAGWSHGFHGISEPEHGLGLASLTSGFYYVVCNLTTVGDPTIWPRSALTRAVGAIIQVQTLLTAGFVLSAATSRLSGRKR
jgi:hypothetical protein